MTIRFMRIFADQYEANYKTRYEAAGIYYEHRLIDDMVAQVSQGVGYISISTWNRNLDLHLI